MREDIAEALAQPFAPEQIRNREGPRGIQLSYIEAHVVIARLNEALDCDWSFEVVEHHVHDNEVVVVGKLTVHGETELTKTAIGCQDIKTDRNGQVISLGNDLKAASSDALKRAARLLGIGLELYDKDARRPSGNGYQRQRRPDNGNGGNGRQYGGNGGRDHYRRPETRCDNGPGNGNGNAGRSIRDPDSPLSLAQLKCIFGIAKSNGLHNKAVADLVNEMFGKGKADDLTKSEASALIDHLKQ